MAQVISREKRCSYTVRAFIWRSLPSLMTDKDSLRGFTSTEGLGVVYGQYV